MLELSQTSYKEVGKCSPLNWGTITDLNIIIILLPVKAKGKLVMASGEGIRNVRWGLRGFILKLCNFTIGSAFFSIQAVRRVVLPLGSTECMNLGQKSVFESHQYYATQFIPIFFK